MATHKVFSTMDFRTCTCTVFTAGNARVNIAFKATLRRTKRLRPSDTETSLCVLGHMHRWVETLKKEPLAACMHACNQSVIKQIEQHVRILVDPLSFERVCDHDHTVDHHVSCGCVHCSRSAVHHALRVGRCCCCCG